MYTSEDLNYRATCGTYAPPEAQDAKDAEFHRLMDYYDTQLDAAWAYKAADNGARYWALLGKQERLIADHLAEAAS